MSRFGIKSLFAQKEPKKIYRKNFGRIWRWRIGIDVRRFVPGESLRESALPHSRYDRQKVLEYAETDQNAGLRQTELHLGGHLPPGLYWLSVQTEREMGVAKLMILRTDEN